MEKEVGTTVQQMSGVDGWVVGAYKRAKVDKI